MYIVKNDEDIWIPSPLKLSIGVEIECVLVSRTKPGLDGKQVLRNALSDNNRWYKAPCVICKELQDFQIQVAQSGRDKDMKSWEVGFDATVKPTEDELNSLGSHVGSYTFTSIEIRSPKLFRDKGKPTAMSTSTKGNRHTHEISYAGEIDAVVSRLRERFGHFDGSQKTEHYLYVNSRCGLHVHLGTGKDGLDSFPRPLVKRSTLR